MHEKLLVGCFFTMDGKRTTILDCVPSTDENSMKWFLLFHPCLLGVKDPILGQILTKLQNKFRAGITSQNSTISSQLWTP
jgi:hypothetical protein